jgi:hypothetical protein
MTQEEKKLLLKDLSARVPYEVQCEYTSVQPGLEIHNEIGALTSIDVMHNNLYNFKIDNHLVGFSDFKPFLRPMSSMTPDERFEYDELDHFYTKGLTFNVDEIDWLLAHHFDFRGLIEKGLALEAPEGMYKTE